MKNYQLTFELEDSLPQSVYWQHYNVKGMSERHAIRNAKNYFIDCEAYGLVDCIEHNEFNIKRK